MVDNGVVKEVVRVPARLIDPGPNDRKEFDPEKLRELAESIRDNGLAQPPLLRPKPDGRYEIVAGERRCRAMRLLEWETFPAMVEEMDDERASALMLAENVQRADLNPIEEAMAYQSRMERYGWSVPRVAREANVPESRVRARLPLLDLLVEFREMVKEGHLGVVLAAKVARLTPENQRQYLRWSISQTTPPTVKRATECIDELYAAQQQSSLFNTADFSLATDVVALVESAEGELRSVLPTHPLTREIDITQRTRGVVQAMDAYIADLLDCGLVEQATVLLDFWRKMMDSNFLKMAPADSEVVKRHADFLQNAV